MNPLHLLYVASIVMMVLKFCSVIAVSWFLIALPAIIAFSLEVTIFFLIMIFKKQIINWTSNFGMKMAKKHVGENAAKLAAEVAKNALKK